MLGKIMSGISWIAAAISAFCLAAMVSVVSYQVFKRFLLGETPWWAEETAQILTIYFGLFGAAYAYRDRLHIGMEFFFNMMPEHVRLGLLVFRDFAVLLMGSMLVWYGIELMRETYDQTMAATQIRVTYTYAPLPACGLLLVLFAAEKLYSEIFDAKAREETLAKLKSSGDHTNG